MEVSIQIKGIPETQKLLARVTLVYNAFALKIKSFKTVLSLLYQNVFMPYFSYVNQLVKQHYNYNLGSDDPFCLEITEGEEGKGIRFLKE